jgi:hypothetical protein
VTVGSPIDEYRIACEFLRSYATLRFLRFTVLLGATGGLVGTILSDKVDHLPHAMMLLKLGGLGLTLAFAVMDYSASESWRRLRDRANTLAADLGFETFPVSSPWNPLATTGASRYLHLFLVLLWVHVLFY